MCAAGGNVNCFSRYGKQLGVFSKKLKINLPQDPAVPLLGIFLKEIIRFPEGICTPMFITMSFI